MCEEGKVFELGAWNSLADITYRCTKCGKEARRNGPVNDWYQGCTDDKGHDWQEIAKEGDEG